MIFAERIKGKVETYKKRTIKTANKSLDAFFKILVTAIVLLTLVWCSVIVYVLFYHSYVPAMEHVKPVYLEYESCGDTKGVCSFPSSHVQLTKSSNILMVGQPYSMKLVLEMPVSPANKELGMFMICARLQSKDNTVVSSSCKSAMIRYSSTLVRLLSTLYFAPLYIFGVFEEKQMVVTELYSTFEEDQSYPVTDVYITVQSYFPEIYSAKLVVTAQMSGLRYFMYNWPVVSAILGIWYILIFILFIAAMLWWQFGPYKEYGIQFISSAIHTLTPPLSSSDSDEDEAGIGIEDLPQDIEEIPGEETMKFEEQERRQEEKGETSKSEEEFITGLKTLDESSEV